MKNIFTVSSKNFLIDEKHQYYKYLSLSRLLIVSHSLISISKKCIYHTISEYRYIRPTYMSCGRFHTIYSLNYVHRRRQNRVYNISMYKFHREDEWNYHE